MRVFDKPADIYAYLNAPINKGAKIGFVPTMGALHKGHLSLIEQAVKDNDLVVSSIYVNPIQFNNPNDFLYYPKTLQADKELLDQTGCDVLFLPDTKQMYEHEPRLSFDFGDLERVMEGKYRPSHFNGVAIVVAKLLNIIRPDNMYLGQKDLQQYLIIRQMVKDLSYQLNLVSCPIVREDSGLAMSSRNTRLTASQQDTARALYQALTLAQKNLAFLPVEEVKISALDFLANFGDISVEYFEIADACSLSPVTDIGQHAEIAICVAAYIGGVRLIDNVLVKTQN